MKRNAKHKKLWSLTHWWRTSSHSTVLLTLTLTIWEIKFWRWNHQDRVSHGSRARNAIAPDILLIVKGHSLDSTKHKKIGKMRARDFFIQPLIWKWGTHLFCQCTAYIQLPGNLGGDYLLKVSAQNIYRALWVIGRAPADNGRALQMTPGPYRWRPGPANDSRALQMTAGPCRWLPGPTGRFRSQKDCRARPSPIGLQSLRKPDALPGRPYPPGQGG